jgi:hypothetical protein
MNATTLILPLLMTFASAPVMAQCGPSSGGHSGHGGHGTSQDHSGHQESGPKVKATNMICPVMGQPVKPGRDREVVIRGNYYLVCCDGCGPEMSEHYDKYLDPDGRPLNDPKRNSQSDSKKDEGKAAPAPQGHEGHQH